MRSYVDWRIDEANPFVRGAQGVYNWATGETQRQQAQQQQAAQAQAQLDDPKVRQQKYALLRQAFQNALKGLVQLDPKQFAGQQYERALDNLAQAFTIGHQIRGADLNTMLVAMHKDQGVEDTVKTETFADHHRLLNFLKQVFEQTPDAWYRKDARQPKDRYPPQTVMDRAELDHYYRSWGASAAKYKPQANPAALGQAATPAAPQLGSSTAADMVMNLLDDYTGPPLSIDQLKALANQYMKRERIPYGDDSEFAAMATTLQQRQKKKKKPGSGISP